MKDVFVFDINNKCTFRKFKSISLCDCDITKAEKILREEWKGDEIEEEEGRENRGKLSTIQKHPPVNNLREGNNLFSRLAAFTRGHLFPDSYFFALGKVTCRDGKGKKKQNRV